MSGLKAGETFPAGVKFKYIPWTTADAKVCGFPVDYNTDKEFANKKVVLVSVPGAFTPTCSGNHVPRYIEHIADLKKKGVDQLLIIAPNDAFVQSGWQKTQVNPGHSDDDNTFVIFASDLETKLAHQIGWTAPGDRNGRFAVIIDHGKITYAEVETELQAVTVSGVDAILEKL